MTRQEANLEILRILEKVIKSAPDQRFTQLLHNLNLNDPYYQEESIDTLALVLYHAKHNMGLEDVYVSK